MKLTAINTTGTKSTITVSDDLFGAPVKNQLLGQALRVYTSNSHQDTSRVKTRAEVNRTKKKWFKQKGTGNARHAARSAPIFVGGGVAHGPKGIRPKNLTMSQKQKHQALKAAFSLQNANVIVSEGIESLGAKTATTSKTLKSISTAPGLMLLVISKWNADLEQGIRNISFVKVTTAEHVTALDVCSANTVVISPEAIEALTERVRVKAKRTVAKIAAKKAKAVEKVATSKKEAVKPAVNKEVDKKPAAKAKKAATPVKKTTAKRSAADDLVVTKK